MTTFGCGFVQVYGLSETSGLVSTLSAQDHLPGPRRSALLRSAGRPYPWVEVQVVDVPDERWGETVKAVVVPAQGASVDEAELLAHARASLAGFTCPTSVDVVDVLPRNPSGKVLKRELRLPYWEGCSRQI